MACGPIASLDLPEQDTSTKASSLVEKRISILHGRRISKNCINT